MIHGVGGDDHTHSSGELMLSYDSLRDLTSIMGDVDGDGVADLVITTPGDQTAYDGFAL